jgi:hypothetical protein
VLLLVTVLVVAGVSARSCANSNPELTKDQAVEIARGVLIFDAEHFQVRFVRQGLPTQGYWYVSFYDGSERAPTRVQLVQVDAETGEIVDDGLRDDV